MPTTRQLQAAATRQAILEVARQLFGQQGYDATSLQQIADAAEVTKANVYYYFKTKAALLDALLEPMADEIERMLDEAERIRRRDDRVRHVIERYVALVVRSWRTVGPLNLGDPAMRRDITMASRLDSLAERGLTVMFGRRPTAAETAAYWLLNDLGPALRRLTALADDELTAALVQTALSAAAVRHDDRSRLG